MNSEKPPFFDSWRTMYLALVGYLTLLILVFYALTLWLK